MKRGFTIVELLIYMGLLSILLVVLVQIFASVLDIQTESQAVSSVNQDGRVINSRIQYDLIRGKTISTPTGAGQTGSILTMTDVDGKILTYSLVGTNLDLNYDGISGQVNNFDTQVSGLTFTRLGNGLGKEDTITVAYTLTSLARQHTGYETRNYEFTVGLRPN